MGVAEDAAPPPKRVQLIAQGDVASLGNGELRLEDGTTLKVRGVLPSNLPIGYHEFQNDSGPIHVIVSPGRCHLPEDLRIWGWAVQLYSMRSQQSWGMGDLGDLENLGRWSAGLGARMLLVNPLHAPAPVVPQESSPYYPSSRRFRNPLYIRVENVPGYSHCASEIEPLMQQAHDLNQAWLIQRDEVFRLKQTALERLWREFRGNKQFDDFVQQQGAALTEFATYCAIAERFGKNWRQWDAKYRSPWAAGVSRFRDEHAQRVRYHAWLQWLVDQQLQAAATAIPLMQDLPIAADAEGADAWAWQDLLADGVAIGAPPDVFNTLGQNWGLPPFVPHRLQAAAYRPFIEVVRSNLRHAGGLRIDHALGLFRLFWIPHGLGAAEGAYVRYEAAELLAILAIESQRARAIVVGEDLGTVEPGVWQRLAEHRVLSYRVLWFEDQPPEAYPELALAAVTTHDLPTIAGLWMGADLEEQRALSLQPNEEGVAEMRQRLLSLEGIEENDPPAAVVEKTYRALAAAPCVILAATLEDVLLAPRRPNMPSTTPEQRPNWSIALPATLERSIEAPLAQAVAGALAARQTGEDGPRAVTSARASQS